MGIETEPTLRERLVRKAQDWIDNNIPVHTRQEYRELLRSHEDVVIRLMQLHQSYHELQEAYHNLQKEAVKDWPMPTVVADARVDRVIYDMAKDYSIQFNMDPYRMNVRIRDTDRERFNPDVCPELFKAFSHRFHKEYVPRLWEMTKSALVGAAVKGR